MNDARFEGLSRRLAGTSSRRQALKLLGGGVAAGTVAATGLRAASAERGAGKGRNPLTDIKVDGFLGEIGDDGSRFKGTFAVEDFAVDSGVLYAVGTLTGRTKGERGWDAIAPIRNVPVPVTAINGVALSGAAAAGRVRAQAVCEILTLTLGPLDLNLLGLRIQLNRINLRITGVTGSLLGDLLCAIAGLLSGGGLLAGLLAQIADLLDDVLAALG